MAAIMTFPDAREVSAVEYAPEQRTIPVDFQFFPDIAPPEPIQELVNRYNYQFEKYGETAVLSAMPKVKHDRNGLSFACHGEKSKTLILMQNPFATDLSPIKQFRGKFLYDSMVEMGVVGPDGQTPQVLQIASASHDADIPLKPREHFRLAHGDIAPVADKIAETVFKSSPEAEQIISLGYSLSAFLTPDILMSLGRGKDILAALIANPPGVMPESLHAILGHFAHAGTHMGEHLARSGLRLFEPKNIVSKTNKLHEKANVVADIVWRPTNFSLWKAFSKGQLLERIETLHRLIPDAVIDFVFGYEDALCHPEVLETSLHNLDYNTSVIENGDHSWGANLPRSMGHLATQQIRSVLEHDCPPRPQFLLAA